MRISSKSKARGEPAVRQTRGPGMNLGLKKPRFGKFPKVTESPSKPGKDTAAGKKPKSGATSYLPDFMTTGKKPKK
jgi:hypothetical protein